ncbi:MAG: arabinosyltransferase [Actinomycetota bacterium]|nr:arabinosyltransferase [Actinomycetota bacterium]
MTVGHVEPEVDDLDPSGPGRAVDGARRRRTLAALLAACAALTLAAALAFPFAPVTQPVVAFDWPTSPAPTPVALALMPYQPVTLDASVTCAAARSVVGDLLTTTPPTGTDARGLRLVSDGRVLRLTSFDHDLATVALPAGPCVVAVASDPQSTRVTVEVAARVTVVADVPTDVRPVVAGVFTAAALTEGLHLHLVTDTRFQTTPSAVKWWLAAGCVAGGLGVLALAWVLDGPARRRLPRPGRPAAVDVGVVAVLAVWTVIGPASVDDGYLASMIRSRASSGFLGNVQRWLNAPEAPFSWYAEVHAAWAGLAPGPAPVWWLRIPALVLALTSWTLLSRCVLPRLGALGRVRSAPVLAAVAFAAWWLPFGTTLRPDPWVATGGLAVWVLTERAIATRRLLPCVSAVAVAAWTVAVTPSGLLAVMPLLVAVPAAVQAVLTLGWARSAVAGLAATAGGSTALLAMCGDQSFAAIRESTRVRELVGTGADWSQEYLRYVSLLTPGDMGGSLAYRTPVLVLLVALGAVSWSLTTRVAGLARGPARRLVLTAAFSLVALVPSPTKWPMHFADLAGVGAGVLFLLLACWSPAALRRRPRGGYAAAGVLGGLVVAGVLVSLGFDNWAWVSDWGVPWNDRPPLIAGIGVADLGAVIGPLTVLIVVLLVAGRRARHRSDLSAAQAVAVAPGSWALVLLLGVVVLLFASFLKVPVTRAGTYSIGGDDLAALARPHCGLADSLSVEPDPAAGMLAPAPGPSDPPVTDGFTAIPGAPAPRDDDPSGGAGGDASVPLVVAGQALPGWRADPRLAGPATLRSGWFLLTDDQRADRSPVVTTISGTAGPRQGVRLEFTADEPGPPSPTPLGSGVPVAPTPASLGAATAPRDVRVLAPPGARAVRVLATDDAAGPAAAARATTSGTLADTPLAVSRPRAPRLARFDDLVRPGVPVLTDWGVALPFPCAPMPALTGGTAGVPEWRVSAPGLGGYGDLVIDQAFGGPFATARELVTQQRIPVYVDGDPLRDGIGLVRWVPDAAYAPLTPQVTARTVSGTASVGRATVPGLDH